MNIIIFGSQWGDEGKGKITDLLAEKTDYVVRHQGGSNAGHIIYKENKKIILSLVPSGILHKNNINVLGSGMVINLEKLNNELSFFKTEVLNRILISDNAHVVFPYHIETDKINEQLLKKNKIGVTMNGIGPAYADKISRIGIQMKDCLNYDILYNKIKQNIDYKKIIYKVKFSDFNAKKIAKQYFLLAKKFKKNIINTNLLLNSEIQKNKNIIFEGAQGAMLSIDFGSYPYVTSSSTLPNAVPINLGISVSYKYKQLAIIKSYTSRVGHGFFITEINDNLSEKIIEKGHEFGSITNRKRRVGWLDLIQLKYVKNLTNYKYVALTLLDVLTNIEKVKICIGYKRNNKIYKNFINIQKNIDNYEPVYQTFDGWKDISQITKYNDLPKNAKKYISFIEFFLNIKIIIISVGKLKKQTIIRKNIWG